MQSLFDGHDIKAQAQRKRPLADALRPTSLDQVVGQDALLGKGGVLRGLLDANHLPSIILWGPPGCGKTTLARIIAQSVDGHFEPLSAVVSGVAELKKQFQQAEIRKQNGVQTVIFVDEIHRFNRAQQDVLLPFVEQGTVTLIGATTENPSFELNAALLSRCKLCVLERLEDVDLEQLLQKAEAYMDKSLPVDKEARAALCQMADGDGRYLLNMCESLAVLVESGDEAILDKAALVKWLQKRMPLYDKHQDAHYNLISALHKSLRGSDVDAALYWLGRMLDGGEDPLYIVRRLVRFAVEDIGLADPQAVTQALAAKDAYHFLGSPEGELAIAQSVVYLATAPKSNASYVAFKAANKDARKHGSLMPPKHILNAPTAMMKDIGYGAGYQYDHDSEGGFSGQDYFPDDMDRRYYYQPIKRGFERELVKRLEYWQGLRVKRQKSEER